MTDIGALSGKMHKGLTELIRLHGNTRLLVGNVLFCSVSIQLVFLKCSQVWKVIYIYVPFHACSCKYSI